MPEHIPPYDNWNHPIVDAGDRRVPSTFFTVVRLQPGQEYHHEIAGYESVCVVAQGRCTIMVDDMLFEQVGERETLWEGKPDSVDVPRGSRARIISVDRAVEVFIAGGRCETRFEPFRVKPEDVDTVQYGSDETKTHRKILHVLGQKNAERRGRLLVSELFTVGRGGWSGFPPHKHDTDEMPRESAFEEVYYFRFDPPQGFGAQFAYTHEDDLGPVYHIKDGSTVVLDKGYHPVVAAPGYRMYYFTILVGKTQTSLVQRFEQAHAYQLETIPGIKDMIAKFK